MIMKFKEFCNEREEDNSLLNKLTNLPLTNIVKSFSVEKGDLFFIYDHNDNLTVIDCNLIDSRAKEILNELKARRKTAKFARFISTHPDQDHINGIQQIIGNVNINQFCYVENYIKKEEPTEDFEYYCTLRSNSISHRFSYNLKRTKIERNINDQELKISNIKVLWPNIINKDFIEEKLKNNSNNISPIITYKHPNNTTYCWMGDLENQFLKKIKGEVDWPKVDILFAPHHGRKSGAVPEEILKSMSPKIIVVGEADADDLQYEYNKYCPTITQNTAGDISFINLPKATAVFVSSKSYFKSPNFKNLKLKQKPGVLPNDSRFGYYIGIL